jgi:hypothetical protein
MNKKIMKLSEGSMKALKMLKSGSATANELKGQGFEDLNSAHLTALVNRGLAIAEDIEQDVQVVVKRKVKKYTLTDKGLDHKEGE